MKISWSRRLTVLALFGASVSIVLVLGYQGVFAKDYVNRAQAEQVVRESTQVDGLQYRGVTQFSDERTVHEFVADDERTFWVDASSGRLLGVVGQLTGGSGTSGRGESVSDKLAAQTLAAAEVSKHVPELGQMQLVEAEDLPDGAGYSFHWWMIDENGAYLPQWAYITVDAKDGSLGGFASRFEPVSIDTKPSTDGETAAQIAEKVLSQTSDRYEAEDAKLMVIRDNNGRQRLAWLVDAVVYIPVTVPPSEAGLADGEDGRAVGGVSVYIDAHTGEDVTGEMR